MEFLDYGAGTLETRALMVNAERVDHNQFMLKRICLSKRLPLERIDE
jgi:hypothetical protein